VSVEVSIMKLRSLLEPLEQAFFELILSECAEVDREVLKDQMGRINKVRRYDDPSRGESQTILYWKSWFHVRRDFPLVFLSDRAEERLAEAFTVVSGERAQVTVWMLTGAIAWISLKPRRVVDTAGTSAPKFELFRLFPDRGANVKPDEGSPSQLSVGQ
jgi:hypothetical protein